MNIKEGFIFPGQGSQYEGMGKKLLSHPDSQVSQEASRVYQEGSDILGYDLAYLCTQATMEQLSTTRFTQPALFATSIAYLRILDSMGLRPAVVAGNSVGEYAALVAAKALDFRPGLELVDQRGKAMEYAGQKNPGRMVAVLGLNVDQVEGVVEQSHVEVASYSEPHQTVIAGKRESIEEAMELVRIKGGRSIMLPVEVASHTSLMAPAKLIIWPLIQQAPISLPRIPFIPNFTGDFAESIPEIDHALIQQLTSPVQWERTMANMIRIGVDRVTEVGPKDVLTKMNRRSYRQVPSRSAEEIIFTAS